MLSAIGLWYNFAMDVVINLQGIVDVLSQPADVLALKFFLYVGWIPIVFFLLWAAKYLWLGYITGKFGERREFMLLAIDVPVGNEQTPLAVEQLFAHLAGAHGTLNLIDIYWMGKTQDWFSFEIVSIDGYTQFLIYGERKYRSFLEQIVYAQYPDAEITEVGDYTAEWPQRLPDENYDLWGSEFVLVNNQYLPLRTYLDFEHQFSGEFKDPLAAMMELFGSLRRGEQCAFQLVITLVGPEWEKGAPDVISDIIGEKKQSKPHGVDKAIATLMSFLGSIADFFIPTEAESQANADEDGQVNMQNLKPAEKKRMEAIQQKVSKIGFEVKIRWIYVAEHEVMDKTRINSLVGVMRQFGVQDMNSLKPDTNYSMTSTAYVRTAARLLARKNRILSAFRSRSNYEGRNPMVLNTEELATLWHFPVEESVRAPLLQKVPSRKAVAPSYLPTEEPNAGEEFDWQANITSATTAANLAQPTGQPQPPAATDKPKPGDELSREAQDIFGSSENDVTGGENASVPADSAADGGEGAPPANLPIG